MEVVSLVTLAALVWKAVDFMKYVRAADWNGVVTQLTVWAVGIGAAFLLSASDFGSMQLIGNIAMSDMNESSLVLIGLQVGSAGSALVDFKKARDGGDSAKTPELLTGEKAA